VIPKASSSAPQTVDEFAIAEQALASVQNIAGDVRGSDLVRPTPCRGFDVVALVDHLVGTITRLGAAAGLTLPELLGGTIQQRIGQVARAVITGWRQRGLDGAVLFAGRTLTDRLALGILALELTVHGWDLSVALGRHLAVPDGVAEFVLAKAQRTLTARSLAIAGFDPPVPVRDDAVPLDRLVAFTGRDPYLRL